MESYANGKPKKVITSKVVKNKDFELHGNFKEERTVTREYYNNGKLKYEMTYVYQVGFDLPCREALYKLVQYDSLGVKRYYLENECDCHKHIEITYNSKGKVLTKSKKVIKRLY